MPGMAFSSSCLIGSCLSSGGGIGPAFNLCSADTPSSGDSLAFTCALRSAGWLRGALLVVVFELCQPLVLPATGEVKLARQPNYPHPVDIARVDRGCHAAKRPLSIGLLILVWRLKLWGWDRLGVGEHP